VFVCDYNLGAGKNGLQILEEGKHRDLIGLATAWIIITAEKIFRPGVSAPPNICGRLHHQAGQRSDA